MSPDNSLAMFHHYIGNLMPVAFARHNRGDSQRADEIRRDLLSKLKQIENQNQIISVYLSKLEKYDWSKREDIELFKREYQKEFR